MSLPFPTSPATWDIIDAARTHRPVTYLAVAAICLLIVLRYLKRALTPVEALVEAAAAAAVVAFAAVFALVMLVMAAVAAAR